MYSWLALTIALAALVAAAWCLLAVTRDRWLHRGHVIALAVVQALVVIQTVAALIRLAGGERPVELATFVGYLATVFLMIPFAVLLSMMERTRWGSAIAGIALFVVAVLTLRLYQVWTPLR